MKMKEEQFYKVCDKVDMLPKDFTEEYYPTVEEIKKYNIRNDIKRYLPIIMYFSTNPYSGTDIEDEEEYIKTVAYCKNLLDEIELK